MSCKEVGTEQFGLALDTDGGATFGVLSMWLDLFANSFRLVYLECEVLKTDCEARKGLISGSCLCYNGKLRSRSWDISAGEFDTCCGSCFVLKRS